MTFVLLIFSSFKLFVLNGGVILAEPDERLYSEAAQSLQRSPLPDLAGIPQFYNLPLYPYLVSVFLKLFPSGYLAPRMISVLSSLLLTGALYLYARWKFKAQAGFLAALLFIVCPFALFYSRVGVVEVPVISFAISSLFLFDYGLTTNSRKSLLWAGVLLGAAVLCKYTALVVGVVETMMVGVRVVEVIREKKGEKGAWRKKLPWAAVFSLFLGALLVLPVAFVCYRHSPMHFKVQTKKSLGIFDDFWQNFGGVPSGIGQYYSLIPWWVSWPILILGGIGVIWVIGKDLKRSWPLLLTFGLFAWQIFTRAPFNIRYFFPLVPFLCLFAGILVSKLKFSLLFSLCSLLLIFPTSMTAFKSTQHWLVEDAGDYILSQSGPNAWIFSNFWPNYFGQAAHSERATWLANSAWETGAFVKTDQSALEILAKEGGWVVFEDLYSQTLAHPPERTEAWKVIKEKYQPVRIIEDNSPNFPQSRIPQNKAIIYKVTGK